MVGVGAKGARRTLIAIRTVRDLVGTSSEHRPKKRLTRMLVEAAQSGTQNSASETHFRVRRPRRVVPVEQSLQTTLMFAFSSSRRENALLARERFRMAATEQGRRRDHQNDG